MQVRAQIASVFHLDKCLGCHTCSVACKNIWTDRPGAEYMWWNNVETKPGTGYPAKWEDQETWRGGWEKPNGEMKLRSQTKVSALVNIFHNPRLPALDDYYEPWTYEYQRLFEAPPGDDQPTARPVSLLSGRPIDIEAGPNWDDDLAGSPVYAANDPNFASLAPGLKAKMLAAARISFFHLPRTCNHCLNPACVAACPSGALHKRGEDGIVLVDQSKCRGWRHCVAACPYKKVYFNWSAGKSEKCILCFPRLEAGEAQACFHSCPGRIRFTGVLLYDASRIPDTASADAAELVDRQLAMILDPADRDVQRRARDCGIGDDLLEAARCSPVFRMAREWRLALPLHAEFRTLPMLFYVPPMSAVVSESDCVRDEAAVLAAVDDARIPVGYLAALFSAGNETMVRYSLRKQQAVRYYRRAMTARDVPMDAARRVLDAAGCAPAEADAIYRLTALSTVQERYVLPPLHRERSLPARGS